MENRIKKIIDLALELKNFCYPNFELSIEYLTIFSKSEKDFQELKEKLSEIGEEKEANNGYKYSLFSPIIHSNETIDLVRIRRPDIHRKEEGCCDFKYREEDYPNLRDIALKKVFDIIVRDGYEMIELSDFNINVYAYLVRDISL